MSNMYGWGWESFRGPGCCIRLVHLLAEARLEYHHWEGPKLLKGYACPLYFIIAHNYQAHCFKWISYIIFEGRDYDAAGAQLSTSGAPKVTHCTTI